MSSLYFLLLKLCRSCNVVLFSDIAIERAPAEAANFEHDKLKHVDIEEKHVMPTQQGKLISSQLINMLKSWAPERVVWGSFYGSV